MEFYGEHWHQSDCSVIFEKEKSVRVRLIIQFSFWANNIIKAAQRIKKHASKLKLTATTDSNILYRVTIASLWRQIK